MSKGHMNVKVTVSCQGKNSVIISTGPAYRI